MKKVQNQSFIFDEVYIHLYTLTESKEQAIFEKIQNVLSKYELTGITKNELIRILQEEGIASRMTFYQYFKDMANPNGANIIRMVVPKGKINALCFPTLSNQALIKLKAKFRTIKDLLDLIEKYPMLGDLFVPLPKLKDVYKNSKKIPPDSGEEATSLYFELIHSKKTSFGEFESSITFRSHKARQDLLKDLSVFLTLYVNSPKMKYSNQVKKESIKILTPIFLRALKIFNEDYSESLNVSKMLKETIQDTAPKNSVIIIRLNKSSVMPHVEVEFLKILGRYYYSISKQFSNKMKLDSCKEQKLISKVITSFYSANESDFILDSQDIKKIIALCDDFSTSRDKEDTLKSQYGFEKNSIVIRLGLYNGDALHIKIYYLELFLELGLFNKSEQKFLEYCLKRDRSDLDSLEPFDPKEIRESVFALFPDALSDYN